MKTILIIMALGVVTTGGIFLSQQSTQKNQSNSSSTSPSQLSSITPKDNQQLDFFTPSNTPNTMQTCADKVAVDFLLDVSTSFDEPSANGKTKLENLKIALKTFYASLKDNDIIGVQTYSKDVKTLVPFGYKRNQANFVPIIDALRTEDTTYTRNGLAYAYAQTKLAIPTFPSDYPWIMVLVTDGAPNKGQEPAPIASQITSDAGIAKFKIIGIELGSAPKRSSAGRTPEKARQLLLEAVKTPNDFLEPDPNLLSQALGTAVCQ